MKEKTPVEIRVRLDPHYGLDGWRPGRRGAGVRAAAVFPRRRARMSLNDQLVRWITKTHLGLSYPCVHEKEGGELLARELITDLEEPDVPPVDPPPEGQSWKVKPGGYYDPQGKFTPVAASLNPILAVTGSDSHSTSAQDRPRLWTPGDTILVDDGSYQHFFHAHTFEDPQPQSFIIAKNPGQAIILNNPVGGSDTFYLEHAGYLTVQGLTFLGDDRAAIMTPLEGGKHMTGPHLWLVDCRIEGGFDPYTNTGFGAKWGHLTNGAGLGGTSFDDPGWLISGGYCDGIGKEHGYYGHGSRGTHVFRGWICRNGKRTGIQDTNRTHELYSGWDAGAGAWLIEGCEFHNMCLEDGGGGSCLSFHGNRVGDTIIRETVVRMGTDPDLHPSLQSNITGALVMYDGGFGPNVGRLVLEGVDFEVGTVHQGDRDCLDVGHCSKFELLPTEDGVPPRIKAVTRGAALRIRANTIPNGIVLSRQAKMNGALSDGFFYNSEQFATYEKMLDGIEGRPGVEILS